MQKTPLNLEADDLIKQLIPHNMRLFYSELWGLENAAYKLQEGKALDQIDVDRLKAIKNRLNGSPVVVNVNEDLKRGFDESD